MRSGRRRKAAGAVLVLLLAGCGVTLGPTEAPEVVYYRVAVEPGPWEGERIPATLSLRPFSQDGALERDGIRYLATPTSGGYWSDHRWALPVSSMVRSAVERDLAASGICEEVLLLDSSAAADYVMDGEVHRFGEEDRADGWYAVVEVTFEIVTLEPRGRTNELAVKLHRRIHGEERCAAKTPAAVVEALGRALGRVNAELKTALVEALATE